MYLLRQIVVDGFVSVHVYMILKRKGVIRLCRKCSPNTPNVVYDRSVITY